MIKYPATVGLLALHGQNQTLDKLYLEKNACKHISIWSPEHAGLSPPCGQRELQIALETDLEVLEGGRSMRVLQALKRRKGPLSLSPSVLGWTV